MNHNKANAKVVPLAIFSLFLAACGGGTDQDTGTSLVTTEQPSAPIQLTARNWESSATSSIEARSIPVELSTQSNRFINELYFYTNGLGDLSNKFWQIHINSDNNPDTGYQFKYNAWSNLSGVDYIIQNGHIFKSTANDSSWSWQLQSESPNFLSEKFPTNGALQFSIDAYNKGICGTFNVGAIVLDRNWSIETFFPVANSMLKQTTTFCETNHPPIITANSPSETITVGEQWSDAGATATDVEDGDISSNITIQHRNLRENSLIDGADIDTSIPGEYLIVYSVTDSQGKSSSALRNLTVKLPVTGSITIDGNSNDWRIFTDTTRVFEAWNGELTIADDKDYLYILAKSIIAPSNVHWQLFIDADDSSDTGHKLQNGGADYLIENGRFSTFLGGLNQHQWSWDYASAEIELAEGREDIGFNEFVSNQHKVFEIAIPKENLPQMGNKVSISFATRDANWKLGLSLPKTFGALLTHTLSNP